jgi:hypothetical protein
MRPVIHRAAVAAFLATGLAAGAWAQMQTPSESTAPNGARVPPGGSALPPGPPGVPAKPGDPLPPPSNLTPNATPRYAGSPNAPATTTQPGAMPDAPPATTQQGGSRARTPAQRSNRDDSTMHDGTGAMHHGTTSSHRGARTDNSALPRGMRQCADRVDRDDRARCASDLFDENGQPKR